MMAVRSFKIINEKGLHARSAMILVNKASQYTSEMTMDFNGKSINLMSIMGLVSLAVGKGEIVIIKAQGNDCDQAMDKLEEVMEKYSLAELVEPSNTGSFPV